MCSEAVLTAADSRSTTQAGALSVFSTDCDGDQKKKRTVGQGKQEKRTKEKEREGEKANRKIHKV
jgi:hypothetical protein